MLLLSSNKGDAMALTSEQQQIVDKATLTRINGWQYLTVEGSPYEIGFEHGYLLTDEFKDAIRVYTHMTLETLGMDYSFFVDQAVKLHKDKIPQEYIEEMQGMADGFTAGGFETSLDDVIGWNDWMELTGYWWPQVAAEYSNNPPDGPKGSHCSGFVATGSATKDGKPVIAHESFDDFWSGQYFNVCESVKPAHGNSFKMQTVPGYIDSMTDFYVTSAGLAITETTIAGFVGYDVDGIPEFVRARKATQYANSIDEWVTIVNEGNNGGYANIWLLADANTNEIARYEQGLKHQELLRTKDGSFYGCNACHNPRIRNLECVASRPAPAAHASNSCCRSCTAPSTTMWPNESLPTSSTHIWVMSTQARATSAHTTTLTPSTMRTIRTVCGTCRSSRAVPATASAPTATTSRPCTCGASSAAPMASRSTPTNS